MKNQKKSNSSEFKKEIAKYDSDSQKEKNHGNRFVQKGTKIAKNGVEMSMTTAFIEGILVTVEFAERHLRSRA